MTSDMLNNIHRLWISVSCYFRIFPIRSRNKEVTGAILLTEISGFYLCKQSHILW